MEAITQEMQFVCSRIRELAFGRFGVDFSLQLTLWNDDDWQVEARSGKEDITRQLLFKKSSNSLLYRELRWAEGEDFDDALGEILVEKPVRMY